MLWRAPLSLVHSGMAYEPNQTNDPSLKSWVESANDASSHFPIQNLPLCAFLHPDEEAVVLGARIGDKLVDLGLLAEAGILTDDHDGHAHHHEHSIFDDVALNHVLGHGPALMAGMRKQLQEFLVDGPAGGQQARRLRQSALLDVAKCELLPPVAVMNYTDFYASIHHATTVGSMFRPDNPLLPNYKHVPIGYHGRASSIVESGTPIVRPKGQQSPPDGEPGAGPSFGPCKMLDYELEVGAFVGVGNELGKPISIREAHEHLAGLCLVNDWSARDIQKWEYQPLGPFLAKNFATTISPYVVTMDALAPFRCKAFSRAAGDPQPLAYLMDQRDQELGGFDITLEVWLSSAKMREQDAAAMRISRSNAFKDMYWTLAQMLAHHTSNGCNMQAGDLFASGTISGSEPGTRGCLLESTWQGWGPDGKALPRKPITLPTGETRTFLADGDEVTIRGWCEREGYRTIGFGECVGRVEGGE